MAVSRAAKRMSHARTNSLPAPRTRPSICAMVTRPLALRWRELEQCPQRYLRGVFDHVGIAVTDLAASERFYRTVLSVLGAEPSHADAELVEWDDWAIGPTDREHPVTRGLHVGFRASSREAVDAFWQAGIDAGDRDDPVPDGRIDHLWVRVGDLEASRRFYATIAPYAGIAAGDDEAGRVQF